MKNSKGQEEYEIDFERVVELVSKYEQIKKSGEIKKYNEESTKKDFILPLFEALGWNVYNRAKRNDSISAEETISKKRVDYGFRINGIPKFFLEAKSLKEENIQTNPKYITQAIDYAWMKSCSWAILCNFETIAVFNADWKGSNFGNNLLFVLHPNDFISDKRFEHLSKVAFIKNELDDVASKYGKKQTKNTINKQLLNDMILFREVLTKDIVRNNQDKHLSQDDLDESVQRILDRLIFIRNAEDRELEENRLQSNVRQWASRGKGELVKEISKVYSYFDDQYNSKLFAKHLCDHLYLDNEVLLEVIEGLNHSKDNSYRYDFSIIESDVLGNIYEQYLGNILKTTPKRAKLSESKTHRKEQGIYYTPSTIVDYIVNNTVGEYLKTHTPEEIKNVKILDPACGSGSFLIRVYKELENYWKEELKLNESDLKQTRFDIENSEKVYTLKTEILKNNIFGVDLDPKAVEIAQLNLLLQISERKHRLPELQKNIKIGNSLIDDSSVSDRAFVWEKEFEAIMKEGGFDIVVGNPPYFNVKSDDVLKASRVYREIANGVVNSASLFMQKGKSLLRESGYLGYIVPKSFLIVDSWKTIRNNLLQTRFTSLKDVSVAFEDVGLEQVVFINQNVQNKDSQVRIDVLDGTSFLIPQSFFEERQLILTSMYPDLLNIVKKIEKDSIELGEISEMPRGVTVKSSEYEPVYKNNNLQVLGGTNVERYLIKDGNKRKPNRYLPKDDKRLFSKKNLFIPNRIVYQNIVSSVPKIVATIDQKGIPTDDTLNNLLIKNDNFNYNYVLGILNSNLMTFYLRYAIINNSTLTVHLDKPYLGLIPIKKVSPEKQTEIGGLVNELLTVYREISEESSQFNDKSIRLRTYARSIENKLNLAINDLYGINKQDAERIKILIS
jgi:type I restriction-modification system DNA methylase subunit